MIKYLLTLPLLCLFLSLEAQNVGIGTNAPLDYAKLDVRSDSMGVLLPRVTNAQMSTLGSNISGSGAVVSAQYNGLMVFNSDDLKLYMWDDTKSDFANGGWKDVLDADASLDDADADPSNELQDLSSSAAGTDRTINITGGTGTTINVADNDNNSSNEFQTLSQTGLTVTLSNGGGSFSVADNDNSNSNELQTLSIVDSIITLSNGGGSVTVPSSADNLGNHLATQTLNMSNNFINNISLVSLRPNYSYDKLRLWSNSSFAIGMNSSMTYGFLNDMATTFSMPNSADRGWIWRGAADPKSDGAMSLTTDGRLTLKSTARLQSLAGTGTRMVTANANGDLSTQAIPANGDITGVTAGAGIIGGGTTGTVTVTANANNGLNVDATADAIQLGGALTEATTITNGTNSLTFNLNSTGDFNLQDNGTTITQFRDDGVLFHGDDMYWRDGSTSGTNLMVLLDDGNDGRLRIYENGATSIDLDANTQFIFNEQGLDRDFRIESDADANVFRVNAALNRVGIGDASPTTKLEITDTGGQTLMLSRLDAAITSGEQLGGIGFDGTDGNTPDDIREASASIIAFASETHGTGDKGGRLTFWTSPTNQDDDTDGIERVRIDQNGDVDFGYDTYWRDNGTTGPLIARLVDDGNDGQMILYENGSTQILFDANGTSVFNEQGFDRDFRVESDDNANMLKVDAGLNSVGIGIASPAQTLHVAGSGTVTGTLGVGITNQTTKLAVMSTVAADPAYMRVGFNAFNEVNSGGLVFEEDVDNNYGATQICGFAFQHDGSANRLDFVTGCTSITPRMSFERNGQIGIATTAPTAALSVNGTANKTGGGSWAVFSDQRIKKDITTYEDGLEEILKIEPVKFKYTEEFAMPEDPEKEFVGVIAQDMLEIAPYMVDEVVYGEVSVDPNDADYTGNEEKGRTLLQYDPSALDYMLINAVKELAAENEQLRKELDELKKN